MDAMKAARFRRLDGDGKVEVDPTYERPAHPGVEPGCWQVRYPGEGWKHYVFPHRDDAKPEPPKPERRRMVNITGGGWVGHSGYIIESYYRGAAHYTKVQVVSGDGEYPVEVRTTDLEYAREPGYYIGGEFTPAEAVHSAADLLDSLARSGFERNSLAVAAAIVKERIEESGGPTLAVSGGAGNKRALRDAYFNALAAEYIDAMPVGEVREKFGGSMYDLPDATAAKERLLVQVQYMIGERFPF